LQAPASIITCPKASNLLGDNNKSEAEYNSLKER
jgi:hypothetical protein